MITAKHLRAFGIVLLTLGLVAASAIFYLARSRGELGGPDNDLAMKREVLQWEKMGGKSLILFNDMANWFSSLWHGQRLAYTVGVLSIAGFLACRRSAANLEALHAQDDRLHPDDKPA